MSRSSTTSTRRRLEAVPAARSRQNDASGQAQERQECCGHEPKEWAYTRFKPSWLRAEDPARSATWSVGTALLVDTIHAEESSHRSGCRPAGARETRRSAPLGA